MSDRIIEMLVAGGCAYAICDWLQPPLAAAAAIGVLCFYVVRGGDR